MTWSKLDDTLHAHPKAQDAGLEAMGLWALTLSHCGAYRTDGHVKRAAAQRIAGSPSVLDRLATVLVRVGLWELHVSGDGWQVHDFLAYNPSRAEVQAQRSELSEKRAEAGRKGAASRWQRDAFASGKPDSNGTANGDGKDGNCHGADHGPVPTRPDPDPDPVPPPHEDSPAPPGSGVLHPSMLESPAPAEVRAVFDHWTEKQTALTRCARASLKLTKKREGNIRARLREGYTVDQLKQAIDGMFGTPFNVDGHHTDVELACRDAVHVDRYMAGPPRTSHRNGFQQQPAEGPAFNVDDGTGGSR